MGCVSSKGFRPHPSRVICYSPLSCYASPTQQYVDHHEECISAVSWAPIPFEELNPETYKGSFLYLGSRYKHFKTLNPPAEFDDLFAEVDAGTKPRMPEDESNRLLVHHSSEEYPRRCNTSMRHDVEVIDTWVLMEDLEGTPSSCPFSGSSRLTRTPFSSSRFSQSLRKASSRSSLIEGEDARSYSSIGLKFVLSSANSSFHPSPATQSERSRSARRQSFDVNARSSYNANASFERKYGHVCVYFDGTKSPYRSPHMTRHSSKRPSMEIMYECGSPLFDPSLLAAFEQALKTTTEAVSYDEWLQFSSEESTERSSSSAGTQASFETTSDAESLPLWQNRDKSSSKVWLIEEAEAKSKRDLASYDLKCPPRGEGKIVLYVTSLRGIRKTYEDCCDVRLILRGLGARVDERDLWMHAKFKRELMDVLRGTTEGMPVRVPQLFIKGRYIGGAEEVKQLHEEGILEWLMDGLALGVLHNVCEGCGDARFLPCFTCSGSRKVLCDDNEALLRCHDCNENGLIMCPMC